MQLILIGCEYAGKTALAKKISTWMIETMRLPLVRWHNHFVVPRLDEHMLIHSDGGTEVVGKDAQDLNTIEDENQIMSLRPSVLEQLQRHNIWRHLHPDILLQKDVLFINHYYADAVYAPIYYKYGQPGSFADRKARARSWDSVLLKYAPNIVLILLHATSTVIRQRMRQSPRERVFLKERNIIPVLKSFHNQYRNSKIQRKFDIDTTDMSTDTMFQKFLENMDRHLSETDRQRMKVPFE